MWYGNVASVPAGWQFCNGANGTPDMRDRFIVCAKQDFVGIAKTTILLLPMQTGGSLTHDHSLAPGAQIIDSVPAGNFLATTQVASMVPPFYALAYIMKL